MISTEPAQSGMGLFCFDLSTIACAYPTIACHHPPHGFAVCRRSFVCGLSFGRPLAVPAWVSALRSAGRQGLTMSSHVRLKYNRYEDDGFVVPDTTPSASPEPVYAGFRPDRPGSANGCVSDSSFDVVADGWENSSSNDSVSSSDVDLPPMCFRRRSRRGCLT